MQPDDRTRITHMIEAADAVSNFLAGHTRRDLDDDLMLRFALTRAAEIFGEAASKVSPSTRDSISEVPWPEIIGMRNRLVHAYFDINRDILWRAATEEIPPLAARLREFLEK